MILSVGLDWDSISFPYFLCWPMLPAYSHSPYSVTASAILTTSEIIYRKDLMSRINRVYYWGIFGNTLKMITW